MTDALIGSIIDAGMPLVTALITLGEQILKRNPDMTAEDLAVLIKANAAKAVEIIDADEAMKAADQAAHPLPPG
jgi:hypothetical protein